MNLALRIIGGLVRYLLAGFTGWLVGQKIIEESQVEYLISAISIGLFTLAWSVADKYGVILWIKTALRLQPGASEELLKHEVKQARKDKKNLSIKMLVLFLCASLITACTRKPATPTTPTDPLHTIAVQCDRAAIGLAQGFAVRAALVSDRIISAEAGERVRAALARATAACERFRAVAATYSDFASGQVEMATAYNELVAVASNLAVDFGLNEEIAERIAPIARFVFQVLEALRPYFSAGREAAISITSLPVETIGAMISVVAKIRAYERGRSGMTTAEIFGRAKVTLEGAR